MGFVDRDRKTEDKPEQMVPKTRRMARNARVARQAPPAQSSFKTAMHHSAERVPRVMKFPHKNVKKQEQGVA